MSRFIISLRPFVAMIVGLALGLVVAKIAGESPWHVLQILGKSAFGSRYDFGMTLFYTTPLILTGLSVSIAFHAGLFNIGAEGQLTVGAMAAAAVGALCPGVPAFLAPWLAGLAAFVAGGVWGFIPGWLKAKRGSHEVINTIMLNFIAVALTSYVTLYLLKNPDSQNPETRTIAPAYLIRHLSFFGDAPVSAAFFLALAMVGLYWVFLWKTSLGYEFRAVGQNEKAAQVAGIRSKRIQVFAMILAGGLAGLVGVGEVLGNSSRFKMGFSPDFGFMGIAVALLGRNRPFGILASALLFGALHKGSGDLDLETEHVTRDLSLILQALIILCVSAEGAWAWIKAPKMPNWSRRKGVA